MEQIDRSALSRANQVDAALLANDIDYNLFGLDVLEEWAWNPLYYVNVAGSSIYALVAREFGKPCVAGIDQVTTQLRDGEIVEVDGNSGVVRMIV